MVEYMESVETPPFQAIAPDPANRKPRWAKRFDIARRKDHAQHYL